MKFGRRHWSIALLVAAILQLVLAAALFRPHAERIAGRDGGVEIWIGSSRNEVGGREEPKTVAAGETVPRSPSPAQARNLSPAAAEPASGGTDPLADISESDNVAIASPPPESAPTPSVIPDSVAQRRSRPGLQSGTNPPEESARRRQTAGRTTTAQSGTAQSKSDGGETTQTTALPAAGKGDIAGEQVRTGATASNRGPDIPADVSPDYYRKLAAWLEKHKRYPLRAIQRRQQGVVRVSFRIDRMGNLLSREIVSSSGYRLLDEAADSLLLRASPMPGIPGQSTAQVLELIVPIKYALN